MQGCVGILSRYLDIVSCARDNGKLMPRCTVVPYYLMLDNGEVRRYKRNWIVIHTTTFLMSVTYTIVLSSQHQFVTNPRDPEDPNVRMLMCMRLQEGGTPIIISCPPIFVLGQSFDLLSI